MRGECESRIKKEIRREIINSNGHLKNHLETYYCRSFLIFIHIWKEFKMRYHKMVETIFQLDIFWHQDKQIVPKMRCLAAESYISFFEDHLLTLTAGQEVVSESFTCFGDSLFPPGLPCSAMILANVPSITITIHWQACFFWRETEEEWIWGRWEVDGRDSEESREWKLWLGCNIWENKF